MKRGLVLGKFHPLHVGHIALINFASQHCDELIVMVCASEQEAISGDLRLEWMEQSFTDKDFIKPVLLNYLEEDLPSTSVASREISGLWAEKIKEFLPPIDIFISSEYYGEYVAESLGCESLIYDLKRKNINISASQILENTFRNWDFLSEAAKPYFVKKICIYGTESTGKSTLTEKLAAHFNTSFVPEMARELIEGTQTCQESDLLDIAELHATTINEKMKFANKILIVDTDLKITSSYSKYLFHKELVVGDWVRKANQFDLYLYLDKKVSFHQDGTRLEEEERNELDVFHYNELVKNNSDYILIDGNWAQRFERSVEVINNFFKLEEEI